MPSIQFDVPVAPDPTMNQQFAQEVGEIYADIMRAAADLLTVSVHALGHNGVWRCHASGPPTPSALVLCDIRRGRTTETRAVLARALIELCARTFDLDPMWIKVEFTQHDGDDMYHPHLGGFNQDWAADEGQQ